jgi:hypothetical protein
MEDFEILGGKVNQRFRREGARLIEALVLIRLEVLHCKDDNGSSL